MAEFFDAQSYQWSWYALPVGIVGVATWLQGILTLWRERGSPPSRTLLLLTFTIGLWLFGLAWASASATPSVGVVWIRISFVGTAFLPVAVFLHAALGSPRIGLLRVLAAGGALASSALLYASFSSQLLFDHAERYFWGYYPVYGPLGWALIGYYGMFFFVGGAVYRLGREKTASPTEKKRMHIRLLALLVSLPATVDFLATQGIEVYPFGYLFISAFIGLSTYSVWRYRMIDITPALAAEQITETMNEGLIVVDREGYVRVANEAATRIWPQRKSLVGLLCQDLDDAFGTPALSRLLDPEAERSLETTSAGGDAQQRHLIIRSSALRDHLGAWVGTVYVLHDITDRWAAEGALRESEERFRSLVQNASDLITVVGPDTTIMYQSPAVRRVLGFEPEATLGRRIADFLHPEDRTRFIAALQELMHQQSTTIVGEGRLQDAAGDWRHLEFTGSDLRAHPSIGGLVLNVRDVTDRKRLEDQMRHQALHDPLTGLSNRTRFSDRLDHALQRTLRSDGIVAVLFMDLDNFKGVNDSMGHSAGDQLLVQVGERLQGCLRPADTVARLGGDEFAILLELSSTEESSLAAQRILDAFHKPFTLEGRELFVRASIGVSTTSGMDAAPAGETLLREADTAMYVAKASGRGCYRIFEPQMQESAIERLELMADLPAAVERNEFLLEYQPIMSLATGDIFGVEALVRWQHPRRGLVQPGSFIPIAEDSGAIVEIGAWVLAEACSQGARWQEQFGPDRAWKLSVNVSVHQLKQPEFVSCVEQALASSGLEPRRLILEITESVLMPHDSFVLSTVRALKQLGVTLAIDDFGTGYSSIAYLRDFPFDLLKIDKSFIDDMGTPRANVRELTRAIVELGKTLNLDLIAEGIERGEQLAGLQSMDCSFGQGFYFAHPLNPQGVEELFTSLGSRDAAA